VGVEAFPQSVDASVDGRTEAVAQEVILHGAMEGFGEADGFQRVGIGAAVVDLVQSQEVLCGVVRFAAVVGELLFDAGDTVIEESALDLGPGFVWYAGRSLGLVGYSGAYTSFLDGRTNASQDAGHCRDTA